MPMVENRCTLLQNAPVRFRDSFPWKIAIILLIFVFSVTYVKKDNPAYKGCPGKEGAETKCNKKLVDEGNGNFRCEKCQLETTKFNWRLVLKAQVRNSKNSTVSKLVIRLPMIQEPFIQHSSANMANSFWISMRKILVLYSKIKKELRRKNTRKPSISQFSR